MGSRGSNTYSAPPATRTAPTTAAPMQRTITPNTPGATAPVAGGMAAAAAPSRSGTFMAGLAGGLLGVGLGGLLMGHGFFGGGLGGIGFLGLLLQIALIGGLLYFALRLFRGRQQPAMAGGPNLMGRDMMGGQSQRPMMGGSAGGAGMGRGLPPITDTKLGQKPSTQE